MLRDRPEIGPSSARDRPPAAGQSRRSLASWEARCTWWHSRRRARRKRPTLASARPQGPRPFRCGTLCGQASGRQWSGRGGGEREGRGGRGVGGDRGEGVSRLLVAHGPALPAGPPDAAHSPPPLYSEPPCRPAAPRPPPLSRARIGLLPALLSRSAPEATRLAHLRVGSTPAMSPPPCRRAPPPPPPPPRRPPPAVAVAAGAGAAEPRRGERWARARARAKGVGRPLPPAAAAATRRKTRGALSVCSASTCAPPRRAGRAGAAVMSRRHPPTHLVGRGPGGAARGWKGVVWPTKAASAPHQRVSGDSRLTSGVLARRRCRGGPGAGAPLARAGGAAGGPRGQGAFGADLITLTQERRRGRSRTWRVIA